MSVGEMEVAKKRAEAKGPEPPKARTIGIRATGEWGAWVDELAEHCRLDVAKLIDLALTRLAKDEGFLKRPPKRMP